jgi:hypothetical protein
MELKLNNENKKREEINKNKELLISLIKQKLENRLSRLERRNKMHLSLINVTTQTIKDITEWSININNQIKEKNKKNNKTFPQNKTKKFDKIEISSNTRKQSYRSKTPLRSRTTKTFITEETKALTINRKYSKSNKYFNLNNAKSEKLFDTKTKSNSFIIKKKKRKTINYNYNNLNIETDLLKRPSIISNKSNKTTATKKNKNMETPIRKKTPFKKKNLNDKSNLSIKLSENKSFENIINSRTVKRVKKKKDDITKMETELQKGEFLTNNDPLLISPITDLDFFNNKKNENNDINNINSLILDKKEKEKIKTLFNNIDEKIYSEISDFLNMDDLIHFKNISKHFHKLFNIYIVKYFQKDIIYFNKKLENININKENSPPEKKTLNEFTISEKCIKAIQLLNEPSVNQFFYEKTSVDENRLIIYRIFFQLIKHSIINIEKDKKEIFWEKCKYYFSHENEGKVGELLQKILDEKKINIEGNNLYKIYKLVYKDLDKIYPKYFLNFCGTTGLITFFIKDILDFVGISNNKEIEENAYWTYTDIIEELNKKIDYLKKSRI